MMPFAASPSAVSTPPSVRNPGAYIWYFFDRPYLSYSLTNFTASAPAKNANTAFGFCCSTCCRKGWNDFAPIGNGVMTGSPDSLPPAGVRADQRHLRLGEHVLDGDQAAGADDPADDVDLFPLEQPFRAGLGGLRILAVALVGGDHLDVAAAELAAVELEEEGPAVALIRADLHVLPGFGEDQPDLHRTAALGLLVASEARAAAGARQDACRGSRTGQPHEVTAVIAGHPGFLSNRHHGPGAVKRRPLGGVRPPLSTDVA